MQLGMIGLGRMGANMVRRLLRGGQQCVAYDPNAQAVQDLAKEGAVPAHSLDELVAQLDANLIVPMPLDADESGKAELSRFLHEMSVEHPEAVPKLAVTSSSVPSETTVVLLEARGRT